MNLVKKEIVKDKGKLTLKLFVMVWVVLLIHVILKLTFNYWQPYVIPNEQLQAISDFIDRYEVITIILDGLFYIFNGYVVICCCLQKWHLGKKLSIITLVLMLVGYIWVVFLENTIITMFLSIIYPLILNYKKWKYIILTFIFNNLFIMLSLWLESFANVNDMQYIISVMFTLDYYIMLILNYFGFNFLRIKGEQNNGK